ncbi:MAG: nucleotidyltransferase domain-containing protein [Myxococcota bacterium]
MWDEALLDDVRRRLADTVRPLRLVAFGSRARGDARPDSDLDLMVVTTQPGSLLDRGRAIYRHLLGLPVPVDLVIYTPEEYQRLRRFPSTVAGIADREGRVLVG